MKQLVVKEWFANKVAQEVGANINMCDVFAVLKETEKAYYAMLNLGTLKKKTMWIPKSVVIEIETENKDKETLFDISYEEACDEFKAMWEKYI